MNIWKGFVVFEGLDGSGTTTQVKRLEQYCHKRAIPHTVTCEPSRGKIGQLVRHVLSGSLSLQPESLALLFAADRQEHLYHPKEGVKALLSSNRLVISDRYFFSSLAYQSLSVEESFVWSLNRTFPFPEILFYLELEPSLALSRMEERGHSREIFETRAILERVKNNYERILASYTHPDMSLFKIEANSSPEAIHKEVIRRLKLPR